MKKLLLTLVSLFMVLVSFAQLPDSEIIEINKLNCDQRILLHYTYEDVLAMDSVKFDMIKYYYCDSYILDTTNAVNFDINTFDISIYEGLRKDDEYFTFTVENIVITLIPKNQYNKLKLLKKHI